MKRSIKEVSGNASTNVIEKSLPTMVDILDHKGRTKSLRMNQPEEMIELAINEEDYEYEDYDGIDDKLVKREETEQHV